MKNEERKKRLMPGGIPRYIRCYDNGGSDAGGTIDRYTVVFTGNYRKDSREQHFYVGMSGAPFHPQGVCQHGEHVRHIDRPRSAHLGKRIPFSALPADCKKVVLEDYKELWDMPSR